MGRAEGAGLERAVRCAAQATVDALRRVAGTDRATFELLDLKTVEVFDTQAVIIALSVRYQNETRYLVGFSLAGEDDPPQAAGRAVLNSTNRFFERLWSDI